MAITRLPVARHTARSNYYEWCQDHNKPLQAAPFGDVAGSGPVTLPDCEYFDERRLVQRESVSRSECDNARHRPH